MMHLLRERTIFVCYQFFKELRKRFGRKIIFIDGARWYNEACKWLRLKHQVYGNELKNKIERFIQKIKDRRHNVLMMITFRVEGITAIYNMYIIGSNGLYFTYT
jgi:transposase-like protein